MSETLAVSFNNQAVLVSSDFGISEQVLADAERTITGFQLVEIEAKCQDTPVVSLHDSKTTSVQLLPGREEISVSGNHERFGTGRSLLYIAEYLATSVQSARDGIFLAHAASTYTPDTESSIVIIGEKGAGKTTLSIKMCRELGHHLIGNDQVYFGGARPDCIHTYSGNKWFNVRNTAIDTDNYLARLLDRKPDEPGVPAWNAKQRVEPSSIGVKTYDGQAPVTQIIHVRIDPTQVEAHTMAWTGVQRNLIIHERLGRHVLGQATPFQDDRGDYLGSLPLINPEATMAKRDELTRAVIGKGITELFVASSDHAIEYFGKAKE